MEPVWLSFIVLGLGTMFLIGEMLVNTRGIFGVLGFGLVTLHFISYLSPYMVGISIVLYFVGLLCIFIDGKFLNDGTLTTLGLVSMLITVGMSSPSWQAGLYGISGVMVGAASSLLLLKAFPKRKMWDRITLLDRMTSESGYSTVNESYHELIGQIGETKTPLRPVGTMRLNDQDYSVVSNGEWLNKGEQVKVVDVDGTKILVKKF
ncbi:hypothetical protein N781_13015 [Pontibacillus halophilus JSM 076056 = DSM 19796]|uniref:NfeD-like C-terminal domain-containing protein n=1 Tax=Pontibacillus halophilus JSM 076056 = DSM 19796 TaxID=1385510 RepID=A0A0A5HVE8_9BACI|nr:NfeD family protein [Pontibacillus halophilus]KGX87607.1 hypothetical protein N781_13015 [Pontibacillus halophilus JSM 076056 = DSM 19796]